MNLTWLRSDYPFEETFIEKRDTILWLSISANLILVLLQPFGFSLAAQTLHFLGFLIIGLLSFSINYFGFPYFFPAFFEESKWSISKAFLFLFYNFLLIGLWNHIYQVIFIENNIFLISSGAQLAVSLFKTVIIGFAASVFLILIRYNFLTRRHLQISQELNLNREGQFGLLQNSQEGESVELRLEDDTIVIVNSDLKYISAEGNYVALHFKNEEKTAPQLYRATMKQVEEQLKSLPEFFRCHRSFIINLHAIESSRGNSQGLFIKMDRDDHKIPVARPKIKLLRHCLKQNQVSKSN